MISLNSDQVAMNGWHMFSAGPKGERSKRLCVSFGMMPIMMFLSRVNNGFCTRASSG